MTVNVPIELNQEIIDELVQLTKQRIEEEKQQLKIGDTRLNNWIDHGLKVIPFGKETRFDREDVKLFLDSLKI
ncbi:hypothetical protein K5E_08310 [Enterococcus thailandicus]|uniref:Uncharacterized protein n=1 Tax=Enterococcus thailandicus TaxID=417368 RepID=A0A510WBJ2_ENTTH|nr:DNA-binding protein [Enterococcus thailandicus]MEA4830765.1 DNA-binding protein [Enterococcus thailandicus]OJG93883.1 hypothetical protein RV17_GL000952 [Enterococcus thailandicus]GEK36578.1 hypothetical protein ETH01_08650 [Enterococcus thailandicus]GMC03377.1 hypothetical protein K4E_08990 [Enterococcus thailandicus]GMC08692.1 hypothetical protein K5E_08310 [Enterococcus thailandicus]